VQERACVEKQKLAQGNESKFEQTHLEAFDPSPQWNQARAKILINTISENPSDPGVALRIAQLYGEGTVRTT
jgi:hypothetical protein